MSPSSRKRKREIRALEDHVNLVRAIRTRRTFDLEKHLSTPQEDVQTETESVSSHASGEQRNWTRWPLLNGDVHVPEWVLADEVEEMVSRLLKADQDTVDTSTSNEYNTREAMVVDSWTVNEAADHDEHDADNDEHDNGDASSTSTSPLPVPVLRGVTESAHVYLTHVLHAMALARPAVHSVLTRRLSPLDWISVLEMVGAHGLADIDTIQYVREVMEDIHGPADLRIIDRMQAVEARRSELRAFATIHDNIEDQPPIPRRRPKTVGLDGDVEMEDVEGVSDEDRPIRSREIISDSDVPSSPSRNKDFESLGLLIDPDLPRAPMSRRTSVPRARTLSSVASSVAESHDSEEDDHRGRQPTTPVLSRRSSRRVSAPMSRAVSRARTPADLSEDNLDGTSSLSRGWRVSAANDDDFEAPRKARPAKRAKSMPRRQTPSRARSKSRGA